MMSRGVDCSEYFADVVKNVASPTLEIKKLVYIYLLTYAESEPDLSLLSINTIQKALTDQNQVVRAMAIRVMSGIKVPVISQIVALGIKRCVSDMSPYVRKAAALAIPKCYRLDPSTLPLLTDYVNTLLGDKSYYVIGAAVMAWWEVCPERIDMVHPHYRGFCKLLIDMDEWGQLALLRLLAVYARKNFPKIRTKSVKKRKTTSGTGGFYSDEESGNEETAGSIDPDLKLLLDCCPPLLQSRNSAVILAVARTYYHLAPPSYLPSIAPPLLSLLRAPQDIQNIALTNIVFIALTYPSIFAPHAAHFLVSALDTPQIWKLKFEALTLVYPYADRQVQSLILTELSYYAGSHDKDMVREAVKAIGRCAQNNPEQAPRCLKLLMQHIQSPDQTLVAESLTVIRHIIQQHPGRHKKTVVRLAKALDTASNSAARASIIWLVGEFAGVDNGDNVAADVLRILAKSFVDEAEGAKLQILLLAAKVYAHYLNRTQSGMDSAVSEDDEVEDQHPIPVLFNYIARLARFDVSYDIRDRARMYMSLLSVPKSSQLATLILLAPKPVPFAPSPSAAIREGLTVGSAALMVGKDEFVRGYVEMPEWVSEADAPSAKLRDPVQPEYGGYEEVKYIEKPKAQAAPVREAANVVLEPVESMPNVKDVNEKTLDEWLEDSEEEEDSEEGEDEEEESEYETDEEEEESEEEETDEEDATESSKMLSS
ncbi:AP-3 complex subunit beta, variant 2 [Orbilia ellipsospora]